MALACVGRQSPSASHRSKPLLPNASLSQPGFSVGGHIAELSRIPSIPINMNLLENLQEMRKDVPEMRKKRAHMSEKFKVLVHEKVN